MIATPIFIHTFVVFVRLFWFERRFQHIAREARHLRHARTRSRTKTEVKSEADPENSEKGVRGRSIVVLHKNEGADRSGDRLPAVMSKKLDESEPTSSSSSSQEEKSAFNRTGAEAPLDQAPSLHREVTFADEVDDVGGPRACTQRLPLRQTAEEHIAFLEKQRNPQGKSTLRIPGPRDFDQGHVPETVAEDDDGGALTYKTTSPIDDSTSFSAEPVRRNITIDEPKRPRQRAGTGLSKISVPSPRSNYIAHAKTTSPNGEDDNVDEQKEPHFARLKARTGTFESLRHWGTREPEPVTPYLSWQPTIGRNSAFVNLTEEQREELGGIEYRSLKTLAIVLVSYYVLIHIVAAITYTPWIVETDTFGTVVDSAGINRAWWGIFTSQSMFNDLGFTLTPNSMISFQRAVLPLLFGTFLIIIGNTGFPCMLRFVIWLLSKITPRESGTWEELKFLLDHPRRCFTLLFPTDATAWLFWILVGLNGLDVILYIVLDLHDPVVTEIGSVGYRLLNGLFQASSTRTAGFSTVNLADLHPGIQVSYMVMMYISVFPIAISVRRTNVYEEKSLGIYTNGGENDEHANEPSYVGAHLRRQLSFDLCNMNEDSFTMYSCLFEIVSAYGTVGLSLGYPDYNTSFCGQFSVVSKLVIIAMQIRGRHRGLPYELDRAILLPSESLHKKEDVDAAQRAQRRNSSLSNLQPTSPSEAGHATTTGREQHTHSTRSSIVGDAGHSGKAGSMVGKMMAGLAAGPHFERRPQPHG
ncbi:MAG: hypothetical protein LQ337_001411 [Flavoplaca oasis]|nr:MAG: hypothetical protein LQ337_001411 [Flavoplaca oasis]